jgi:Uma2 family endonuclease
MTHEGPCYPSIVLDPRDIAPERPRALRRAEYEKLAADGAFDEERVELLFGTVVEMSPIGPPHSAWLTDLAERLIAALAERAQVRVQCPLAASDVSEPQPDIAVVPRRSYRDAHPTEAWLIVEVADSSLRKDRGPKARLYAECGVQEYWILNLEERVVEVHRDPVNGQYASLSVHRDDGTIHVQRFPDVAMTARDLVGQRG